MRSYLHTLLICTILAVSAFAAATSSGSGDGRISCDLEIPAGSAACGVGMGPDDSYFEVPITAGQTLRATVTWTPTNPTAENFLLVFDGWTIDCDCTWKTRGSSPLTMEVEWPAEADQPAAVAVGPSSICPGPLDRTPEGIVAFGLSCTLPPVRVARDQPFHYEWTVT